MKNPEYVIVDNIKYPINTNFKIALRCNEILKDNNIGTNEKMMAIIYLLFGDEALEERKNYHEFINLAFKYLSCGEEKADEDEEPDMDFIQDYNLIKASFKSDLGINIDEEDLHFWDFHTYLNGLTEHCILNRIREIRTYDLNDIKDAKERKRIEKQKKKFALKEEKPVITEKQRKSAEKFYELTGIKKKEE